VGISVRQTKTSQRVLTEDGATEDDLRDGIFEDDLFDTNSINAGSAKNSFKRLSKGKTKDPPDTKSAVTKADQRVRMTVVLIRTRRAVTVMADMLTSL
jgi:hypothetical protein